MRNKTPDSGVDTLALYILKAGIYVGVKSLLPSSQERFQTSANNLTGTEVTDES